MEGLEEEGGNSGRNNILQKAAIALAGQQNNGIGRAMIDAQKAVGTLQVAQGKLEVLQNDLNKINTSDLQTGSDKKNAQIDSAQQSLNDVRVSLKSAKETMVRVQSQSQDLSDRAAQFVVGIPGWAQLNYIGRQIERYAERYASDKLMFDASGTLASSENGLDVQLGSATTNALAQLYSSYQPPTLIYPIIDCY